MRSGLRLRPLVAVAFAATAPAASANFGFHGDLQGPTPVIDQLSRADWIGTNWDQLQAKTLSELTLPGSHNSGNVAGEISADRLCVADYRYPSFKAMSADPVMSPEEFDRQFIPWNVNHDEGIFQQLTAGIRWFHMKICNFNDPASEDVDLTNVFHQHRGYTARDSLREVLASMSTFLADHPKEVLALGFNNFHQSAAPSVTNDEIMRLAYAVKTAFADDGVSLITEEDLQSTPLSALVASGRRVAIFFKGSPETLPPDVISSDSLAENWDDSMSSGDLDAAMDWLKQDLSASATRRDKFYVMQANPNDDDDRMLARIRDGGHPISLKTWEWDFLRGLALLVDEAVAGQPQVRINAISTDFSGTSRPFEIAMRLMGLPGGFAGEVHTQDTNAVCLNPAVISGQFVDPTVDDARYALHASYVMQRHTDRWIYGHDYINNFCWPGQQNSSAESSALFAEECDFGTRTLQTAWDTFDETMDPYAAPAKGTCQLHGGTPQASKQGQYHAKMWGEMIRQRYVESGMLDASCPGGDVKLHADAVHKNEVTLQSAYESVCGREPDVAEFPREAVRVHGGEHSEGEPWYLNSGQCGGARLSELNSEADAAKKASAWWTGEVASVAAEVAGISGHQPPEIDRYAVLLDNVIDCANVHACTGLPDVPPAFLGADGLPDLTGDALYARMNRNETMDRTWAFTYFRTQSPERYAEYASLYYGYFFAVLRDQLVAASLGDSRAPKLTISVMSDGNISPQLAFYNLGGVATQRPPYLSALVHELVRDVQNGEFFIRAIYNGQIQQVCPGKDLCSLHEWSELVEQFIPDIDACPDLYTKYNFLAPVV